MSLEKMFENVEVRSTMCVGNGRGTVFDELKDDAVNKKNEAAIGIMVRSGAILDAIGTIYRDSDVILRGNKTGGRECRIIFDEGDKLACIKGVCEVNYAGNQVLSQLKIVTAKGKTYGPFGSWGGGKKFVLDVPAQSCFEGFFGKADTVSVNELGILFVEGNISRPDVNLGDMLNGFELGGK